jgi:hypothetical protein
MRESKRLRQGGKDRSEPVGVVSLALFSDQTMRRVLLGVRRPTPLVKRHPGVLSTPTLAVPVPVLLEMVGWSGLPTDAEPFRRLDISNRLSIGTGMQAWHPAVFAIEHLLARKLGVGDALAAGQFTAEAMPYAYSIDKVSDSLATELSEWTAMLTYIVVLRSGIDSLPNGTGSYTRLVWADVAKAQAAITKRDALIVDMTLNPFEVCVQGLCMNSILPLMADLNDSVRRNNIHVSLQGENPLGTDGTPSMPAPSRSNF